MNVALEPSVSPPSENLNRSACSATRRGRCDPGCRGDSAWAVTAGLEPSRSPFHVQEAGRVNRVPRSLSLASRDAFVAARFPRAHCVSLVQRFVAPLGFCSGRRLRRWCGPPVRRRSLQRRLEVRSVRDQRRGQRVPLVTFVGGWWKCTVSGASSSAPTVAVGYYIGLSASRPWIPGGCRCGHRMPASCPRSLRRLPLWPVQHAGRCRSTRWSAKK